jgi:hypothetical protein
MKLVVKLMVVVLVALSVPALAGRGGSGARSGGFSHSGAHFPGDRHPEGWQAVVPVPPS